MNRTTIDCPVCHGSGVHEEPYYSDFEPKTIEAPCPKCYPVKRVNTWAVLFWLLALFVMMKALAEALRWPD